MRLNRFSVIFFTIGSIAMAADISPEKLAINFGPFNEEKILEKEKSVGNSWDRPKVIGNRIKFEMPDGGTCYRCHSVEEHIGTIQVGAIAKGKTLKKIKTRDSWVLESAIARSSTLLATKVIDIKMQLPVAKILWAQVGGQYIDKNRFVDNPDANTFSVKDLAAGTKIEVFYATEAACPGIRDRMTEMDSALQIKGSW